MSSSFIRAIVRRRRLRNDVSRLRAEKLMQFVRDVRRVGQALRWMEERYPSKYKVRLVCLGRK